MTRALLVSLVLQLFVPARLALAAERPAWGRTFTAPGVASHLGAAPARYIVVPAGQPAPELAQAEQSLTAALRTGGKATLVMSAQALGGVEQLSDQEIVQRSARFPVDRVVVLRLFADATGALTQAVVALYDTSGGSQGTFSAVAGTALAARAEGAVTDGAPASAAAAAGASAEAAPAGEPATAAAPAEVAAAPQAEAPPPAGAQLPAPQPEPPSASPQAPRFLAPLRPRMALAEAKEQYERKHIAFDELVAVSVYSGSVVSRWSVPYEGKFRKSLQGKSFYEKLGRKDLVAAYEKKITTKALLGVLGGAAIVGGGVLAYQGVTPKQEDCDVFSSSWNACLARNDQRFDSGLKKAGVGLGVTIAGGALLGAAVLINPHPVSGSEARELADAYNKQLRVELGLEEDPDAPRRPALPPVLQARLGVAVGRSGAGLQLAGTF